MKLYLLQLSSNTKTHKTTLDFIQCSYEINKDVLGFYSEWDMENIKIKYEEHKHFLVGTPQELIKLKKTITNEIDK